MAAFAARKAHPRGIIAFFASHEANDVARESNTGGCRHGASASNCHDVTAGRKPGRSTPRPALFRREDCAFDSGTGAEDTSAWTLNNQTLKRIRKRRAPVQPVESTAFGANSF